MRILWYLSYVSFVLLCADIEAHMFGRADTRDINEYASPLPVRTARRGAREKIPPPIRPDQLMTETIFRARFYFPGYR